MNCESARHTASYLQFQLCDKYFKDQLRVLQALRNAEDNAQVDDNSNKSGSTNANDNDNNNTNYEYKYDNNNNDNDISLHTSSNSPRNLCNSRSQPNPGYMLVEHTLQKCAYHLLAFESQL